MISIDNDIDEFLRICIDCIIKCQQCSMYSLGRFDTESCSRLSDECAKLCSLVSYFVKHDEENFYKLLPLCISMCNICADECNKFNYEFTNECGAACLKMAIYCRQNMSIEKKSLLSA